MSKTTKCPACDGTISTAAAACPHCGHPLRAHGVTEKSDPISMIAKGFIILLGVLFVLGGIFG